MTEHRSENQRTNSELRGQQGAPTPGHSHQPAPGHSHQPDASVSELKPRAFSIRELSFMGPSNDGTRLLLVDSEGNQFELPVDNRLISVVSREHAPKPRAAAQSATPSPREIQHRVRHGSSIKDIADSAEVPEEHIARFAHPVITERAHMATRARSIIVTIDAEQMPLAEAVSSRIASRGIEAHDLRWDAWRREDGRWTVAVAYPAGMAEQLATFSFDPDDNSITPVGDEATWILQQSTSGPRSVPPLAANEAKQVSPTTAAQREDSTTAQTRPAQAPTAAAQTSAPEPEADRARSWDRAHPAAKAHERRGAAAEQVAAAEQANERAENATQSHGEHPANGTAIEPNRGGQHSPDAKSPVSRQQSPAFEGDPDVITTRATSAPESTKETPQWEELLFGSPRDDD